ncbi:MAG: ATP-binding protein [Bacteroidota bacterium]
MSEYRNILSPFNPWWEEPSRTLSNLPSFQRPIFSTVYEDLKNLPQMISITGPRRTGKSTLLYQLIRRLIADGVAPKKLIYYSFDDPSLLTRRIRVDEFFEQMMKTALQQKDAGATFLFLDEIQRLERWELYLKKYYDLKYPIKMVISGSASSPIFKKSRESLLGRVKDIHLLPFSFREFVLFTLNDQPSLRSEVNSIYENGRTAQGMFTGDPSISADTVALPEVSVALRSYLDAQLRKFLLEGGFPEVWGLPNWVAKQEYLFDNQVKKVIYEDLILAAEFRKPELLKRFYISLLEIPGREISIQSVADETEVSSRQIEKYLPLLEMTDLVYRLPKFRTRPLRVRKGMMKFYLVDLALRNAVLRLTETLLTDETMMGLYAENLVFLALRKWRRMIQMDYYRERHGEVDFVVHVGPKRFLPVEVKFRNEIKYQDFEGLRRFVHKINHSVQPLMITKQWKDFGNRENAFLLPLPLFLLLFD